MTAPANTDQRILAIDPYLRGFGWALLEGPDHLIDWGIYQTKTKRPERMLGRVADLLNRYTPDVLVVEDADHSRCRRRERARRLIAEIHDMAKAGGVVVQSVAMAEVRDEYRKLEARSKDAVAKIIADRFPELRPILPPKRKNWMREDERMAVFDSIALALVANAENLPYSAEPRLGWHARG